MREAAHYFWMPLLLVLSANGACQEPKLPELPDLSAKSFDRSALVLEPAVDSQHFSSIAIEPPSRESRGTPHFHWKSALLESFTFLTISHAYLAYSDYYHVTIDGLPFNHFWRDYKTSLSAWVDSGWDDGDPFLDNYIGHPVQGALTGYIQIQNDPNGQKLEFANSKAYWKSRSKAMLWNAAYSTLWEIGPMGEMTVEKYGTFSYWRREGKWGNSEGQVDLVVTPIAGTAWIIMEDLLDKHIARRVEGSTRNSFLIAVTRCAVNPVRGGANILHRKWPWYRASRDAAEVYRTTQSRKISAASGIATLSHEH
jgi:hypothetical protein